MLLKSKMMLVGLLCLIFMVGAISLIGAPGDKLSVAQVTPDNPKTSGSGSSAIYTRLDSPCPDGVKQKTNCYADGDEQCTAQYCN